MALVVECSLHCCGRNTVLQTCFTLDFKSKRLILNLLEGCVPRQQGALPFLALNVFLGVDGVPAGEGVVWLLMISPVFVIAYLLNCLHKNTVAVVWLLRCLAQYTS